MSDVHLTENCGLLRKLLPGDMILADRGFTTKDSAGLYCAEVCVPPFTKGKSQSQESVDIYFLTLWEYWLGLAKPKNVFRSTLNPSIK